MSPASTAGTVDRETRESVTCAAIVRNSVELECRAGPPTASIGASRPQRRITQFCLAAGHTDEAVWPVDA